jgi:hypothetical protein
VSAMCAACVGCDRQGQAREAAGCYVLSMAEGHCGCGCLCTVFSCWRGRGRAVSSLFKLSNDIQIAKRRPKHEPEPHFARFLIYSMRLCVPAASSLCLLVTTI